MVKVNSTKLSILLGLFVSILIAANLLSTKITTFLGVSFSVGVIAFPLTFLITDIVEEVYGKEKTKVFIKVGLISLIFILLYTTLAVNLPAASRYDYNEEYKIIFGSSIRIMIASLLGFLASQYNDLLTFNFIKKKTKGKFLWFRNNLSTIISQFIDTTVFMFIAFYNITPKFDVSFIFSLIIPYWLLKIVIAIIDTPFCYLGVKWLRK
jgi:queuosine precursor transporter